MTNGANDVFRSLRITHTPLYNQIADKMQEVIAVNQIKPGTQSPAERELAQ